MFRPNYQIKNQPYDASKDARIRLYGQNGRPSYLTVNIDGKKGKKLLLVAD